MGARKDVTAVVRRLVAILVITITLGSCARLDYEQARVCESIVPAVEIDAPFIRLIDTRPLVSQKGERVRVDYAVPDTLGNERRSFLICLFSGTRLSAERLHVTGLAGPNGSWSPVEVLLLNRFWLGELGAVMEGRSRLLAPTAGALGPDLPPSLAYFLQQWVNASAPMAIYAVLALAYALVYGVTGRINLALGSMTMLAAYGALTGIGLAAAAGLGEAGAALAAALALSFAVAAGVTISAGWVLARTVFQPLRVRGSQALLIATVGAMIVIAEVVRLSQGAQERWVQPVLNAPVVLFGGVFPVVATPMRAVILGLCGFAVGAVLILMRTRFGRAWRAVSDDQTMARLCGVDPLRVLVATFALTGTLAATGGFIYAIHYGGTGISMALVIGLKALVAAIVGGIGSLGGAVVGGLLVGLLETFWSAYLPLAWRDVAVLSLLVLVLTLRPQGIFGGREAARRAASPRG